MDPATTCCPHLACPARGRIGQGNLGIHSRQDQRFMCTECHQTFTATKGTAFYRLRTAAETVRLVVTLMAHGGPWHAIVVAFGYDARTVACWLARAGVQGQAVQEHLVEPPRDLGQVHADEIRVTTHGGLVWMALALMVRTRWWLAGAVSPHRDLPLIRRLSAEERSPGTILPWWRASRHHRAWTHWCNWCSHVGHCSRRTDSPRVVFSCHCRRMHRTGPSAG